MFNYPYRSGRRNIRVLVRKKLKRGCLRSKNICGFSDLIKGILPQRLGGSPLFG